MTKTILILCPHIRNAYSRLGKGAFQYDRALISLSLYSSQYLHNLPLDLDNRPLAALEGDVK